MSVGFGFSLPALAQYGGGGNNPFGQLGPTLDLAFADGPTGVGDLSDPNGYTLNTDFISPEYQVAAQYTIWETNVGLVSKTFSQIITFTRASTATFFNSSGVLTSAAINEARLDYNPATLAAQGFLVEEARTNLLTFSAQFDNASWLAADITVTANNTTAPDGTTTADLLTEGTAGTAYITRSSAATVSAGATVTSSFFVKRSSVIQWLRVRVSNDLATNGGNVWFDIQNGVLGNQTNLGSGTATSGTITLINNGWYRVTATTTLAVGDTFALLLFTSASGNGSTTRVNNSAYWVWGAQLEAGAFPTSYIPTTTTALTRSADVASVNTLSPWFNATSGTLFAEFSIPAATASRSQATFGDGTANERMIISNNTSLTGTAWRIVDGGVDQADINNSGSFANNATVKVAGAYAVNDFATSQNGGTAGTDTSGTLPAVTALYLGSNGAAQYASSHLRRITYYPRRLTNDELRTLTLPAGATITTQEYSLDTNFIGNTVAIGS